MPIATTLGLHEKIIAVLEMLGIALSILYVAMARRAGWSAYVLNLPGHVLVQIGENSPVVINPFGGGSSVSERKIAEICRACLGKVGGSSALAGRRMLRCGYPLCYQRRRH